MTPSRRGPQLVVALCALLASPSSAADPESVLLRERELGAGWEVVREAPSDPRQDPDLRGWGVREQHVRHYTRDLRGRIQVCSVEVWAFDTISQATAAAEGFQYPDWEIKHSGALLVMARGLVRMRGRRPSRGVFPECGAIVSRIVARAAAL